VSTIVFKGGRSSRSNGLIYRWVRRGLTFGAKPRPLDFNEVYASLKSGFVDGTDGTAANFYTQNLHYAQKYLTLTNHGYLGHAVIAKKILG
jgi:TRAP-type C4-dicarboxylate transport system substrate-binding protein